MSAAPSIDIDCIYTSFLECYEDDFKLEAYNRGYNQLHDLFAILGTVFGFVASDVREKIDILEELRDPNNPNGEHYGHTEAMMMHETKNSKETGGVLFGSRTLLRLHRALRFTMIFLERLCELSDNDASICSVASSAYKESLANYHPWLIRNAAKLAMYTLPSRKVFIEKLNSGGAIDENVAKEKLMSAVNSIKPVYEGIENLYTKYDLHQLP